MIIGPQNIAIKDFEIFLGKQNWYLYELWTFEWKADIRMFFKFYLKPLE